MSNVVDLFAKKPEQDRLIEELTIANKAFINKLEGLWLGEVIRHAILSAQKHHSAQLFAAIRYAYQVRAYHDRPDEHYVLFTGRSHLERILTGKPHTPREMFQFRFEHKKDEGAYVRHEHNMQTDNTAKVWEERLGIKYTPQLYVAGYINGTMESDMVKGQVINVRNAGSIYELNVETQAVKSRCRFYGKNLLKDQKTIVEYLKTH